MCLILRSYLATLDVKQILAKHINLWARLLEVCDQWCENTLKCYLSFFGGGCLIYFTIYIVAYFYFTTFLKKINVLLTPYIFPDTQSYSLQFDRKMVQFPRL
jgi:hypothetical protein